ncbi:MAG: hypothetical protein HY897_16835 [Deltaproteobacteria bacterium]|nr:hypothetical protein [Deltaproteobacteria bacterium]
MRGTRVFVGVVFAFVVVMAAACSGDGGDTAPAAPATDGGIGSLCTPGEASCRQESSTEMLVCNSGGSGYGVVPCPNGEFCIAEKGACGGVICEPGAQRCRTDGMREVCGPGGGSWNPDPCPASMICSIAANACATVICNPGEKTCSADFASVSVCSENGTYYKKQPCPTDKVCLNTACTNDALRLGEIERVKAGATLDLPPGRYAAALVDAEVGWGNIFSALSLERGALLAPPPAPPPRPQNALSHPACGTPGHRLPNHSEKRTGGPRPPTVPAAAPGDKRTFNVPQHSGERLSRNAVLSVSRDKVNVWVDENDAARIETAVLRDLADSVDKNVVGRITALYGKTTDVDGSGKIDMLITSANDDPGTAAFVTPATLFPPGTFGDYDFGEIIYVVTLAVTMLDYQLFLPALIAHELQHLIYDGSRYSPYFDNPDNIPPGLSGDRYAVEGIAETAFSWSGEATYSYLHILALQNPGEFSLASLFENEYLEDPKSNAIAYGFGAVAIEYLIEQAGGFTVEGLGAQVTDTGGRSFIDSFTESPCGESRLPPLTDWWPDLSVALLASSLPKSMADFIPADPRYHFMPVTADPAGGNRGLSMTFLEINGSSDPVLARTPWDGAPVDMLQGGMAFYDFAVGEKGATIKVGEGTVSAAIIRYGDFAPGDR